MVAEKATPKKSDPSTKSATQLRRSSRKSRAATREEERGAKPRKSPSRVTALDAAPSLAERVEVEWERIFKAISIVPCCWYAMVTKWEVDDPEYMTPAFQAVCDLLNDSAEELEQIASACEKLVSRSAPHCTQVME